MDAEKFEELLDRLGSDFADWPSDAAALAKKLLVHSERARKSYDTLLKLEALIETSRPQVASARANRVVHGALAEIARREAHPSVLDRLLALLLAPLPRAALAVSVTGIGFAVGIAIGTPSSQQTFYSSGNLMMTASADDVLF